MKITLHILVFAFFLWKAEGKQTKILGLGKFDADVRDVRVKWYDTVSKRSFGGPGIFFDFRNFEENIVYQAKSSPGMFGHHKTANVSDEHKKIAVFSMSKLLTCIAALMTVEIFEEITDN